ncbi:hypothetical protein [Nostoc sp. CALU 1950]|uniref:hypothetical protein n=1 Tax=Nostoc sp. CALU 1950 TaxID=3104321 RepID=UPI003EB9C2C4
MLINQGRYFPKHIQNSSRKLLICGASSKIYNYADWKAFEKRFIIQPITIAIAEGL